MLLATISSLLIITNSFVESQVPTQYRFCVPDILFTLCQQMVADGLTQGGRFECIPGNDKIDCISRVAKGEADIVILEPEEIYIAHRFFHDAFYISTEIRTTARQAGSFRYEPIAIVRNSAKIQSLKDLQGKRSCHTAYGRTSGWEVPISLLMQKNVMVKDCSFDATTIEREIASVSRFFSESCAPGQWAPDAQLDQTLKDKYSNLCALCQNPKTCSDDDNYSGFRGALRCLTDNTADVAWTRLESVYQFFRSPSINGGNNNDGSNDGSSSLGSASGISEYSFLCPDGSTVPLNSDTPCTWAGRPWKSFLVTNRLSTPSTISDIQSQITFYRTLGANFNNVQPAPLISWMLDILEFNGQEIEFHVPTAVAATVTPLVYLDRGNYTLTIEKPSCPQRRAVRICVRSDVEKLKCMALRMGAVGRRIVPYFDCILGEDKQDCMRKIATGQADVVTVDAREAFVASRQYRLTPILSEAERFGDEDTDASRYTVAVVRADSGIQYISDLRGKRSCHGSVSSLSGWNIPIIVLRDAGLIYSEDCQFGRSLANFFAGGSCIPGSKSTDLQLPGTLCSLCVGSNLDAPGIDSEASFCANNELEGFYGDLGAFRCLPTLVADVAFTDHLTPLLNTDGLANATWAAGLQSVNFRLICPYGPSRAITEFRQCHWGKIPSDKVITAEDKTYYEREDIRLTLLKASQTFHPEQVVMRLFGPFYGIPNLLFKDISTGLVPLHEDNFLDNSHKIDQYGRFVTSDNDVVYDQQYSNRIIRDIDDCNGSNVLTIKSLQLVSFVLINFLFSC